MAHAVITVALGLLSPFVLQRSTPLTPVSPRRPCRRSVLSMSSARDSWSSALGEDAHGVEAGAGFFEFFASLAASEEFVGQTWARKPQLYRSVDAVAGSFTLDHLRTAVDSDFLEAGRGIPDDGGWKMAPVSKPRGPSFEDAKMRYIDVEAAMKLGSTPRRTRELHATPPDGRPPPRAPPAAQRACAQCVARIHVDGHGSAAFLVPRTGAHLDVASKAVHPRCAWSSPRRVAHRVARSPPRRLRLPVV